MILTCPKKERSAMFADFSINGPDGAHFVLYKEEHHSPLDLMESKQWLRRNHDVLSIKTEPMTDEIWHKVINQLKQMNKL